MTHTNKESIKAKALHFHESGHTLIKDYLGSEAQDRYQNEVTYLNSFPFKKYPLYLVKNQGFFFVNNVNDTIKNVLRKGDPWEPKNRDIIKKYVKPGTLALDIGSHVGTHTVTMSKSVGEEGLVIAFEPSASTYRELCYNLAANNSYNTVPVRAAMGQSISFIDVIVSHPNNEGGKYVVESNGGKDNALQIRLDDLELENISFIKIDVENVENDVLLGAKETLKKNRPVMLIEIQGNGERPVQLGEDTQEMAKVTKQTLQDLDYELKFLGGADYLAFPMP